MNKEKILKSSNDFSYIISKKQCYKNKYYSLYYIKSNKTLYGITVPKKVGKANVRNKLKRRIKNIIINNEKYIQKNNSYVIIIKESSLELDYKELENEMIKLFKKVSN